MADSDPTPGIPPPPGPAPQTGYEYLVIPKQPALDASQPYFRTGYAVYVQIEQTIAGSGASGDKCDLPDGTRVYRIPLMHMWRFGKDRNGAFIGRAPLPVWRFQVVDPSAGVPLASFWMPLN